jgi:hypothetical protein
VQETIGDVFTSLHARHQSRSRGSTPLRLVTVVQVNASCPFGKPG